MGLGGISFWQLAIVLVIVILIFGTKKLRNMGGDLGSAVKNFKSSMKDGDEEQSARNTESLSADQQADADTSKADSQRSKQ